LATFSKQLAITQKRRPPQALSIYFSCTFITLNVILCLQHVCHDATCHTGLSADNLLSNWPSLNAIHNTAGLTGFVKDCPGNLGGIVDAKFSQVTCLFYCQPSSVKVLLSELELNKQSSPDSLTVVETLA